MKQKLHTCLKLSLVLMLIFSATAPVAALSDDDYANNIEYYRNLCSGIETVEVKNICDGYRDYLQRRAGNQEAEKSEIEANKKKLEEDLAGNLYLIGDYQEKIKNYESEIASLNIDIATKEQEIARLEVEIEERLESVKKLEEDVKVYMVNAQSSMRVNGIIEFVMGAKDFADIMRRIEGMNAIKRHNETVVGSLREERAQLLETQEKVSVEKNAIELNRAYIAGEREKAQLYEAEIQSIYAQLQEQHHLLDIASAEIESQIEISSDLENQIGELIPPKPDPDPNNPDPEVPDPGVPAGNLSKPVYGGSYTASVWHYPWGGTHLGNDIAAPIGTPIYSIGDGIVVVARGGCSTTGSWNCNGSMGNHMATIFRGDGKIYGSLVMHMQANSFLVGAQSIVRAGQQVASVGDSGASYGSHAHVEIFYLGDENADGTGLVEALERWNREQRTAQFGLGGSSEGTWSRCAEKGSYPCRLDPGPFI